MGERLMMKKIITKMVIIKLKSLRNTRTLNNLLNLVLNNKITMIKLNNEITEIMILIDNL